MKHEEFANFHHFLLSTVSETDIPSLGTFGVLCPDGKLSTGGLEDSIMNAMTVWLKDKGLELAEAKIRAQLSIPNIQDLIHHEVTEISGKLDAIIQSHYRGAVIYLKEGNIEKCREKLVEAMSIDELDLSSRLLYIDILRLMKKFDLALKYYWDLLDTFGLRFDLVPRVLFDAFFGYPSKMTPLAKQYQGFVVRGEAGWFPYNVSCSLGGLVIQWHKQQFFGEKWQNEAYSWNGRRLFRINDNNVVGLITLTTNYAVFNLTTDKYIVFRMKDGSRLPLTVSDEKYEKLFMPNTDSREDFDFGMSIRDKDKRHLWLWGIDGRGSLSFGGVTITKREPENQRADGEWGVEVTV